MSITTERVYDFRQRAKEPGEVAVLVDRVWPRGIRRADLELDGWAKELAPSSALRKWFGHDPDRWPEFQRRYREELEAQPERLKALRTQARGKRLVLLFGARDETHNNAEALRRILAH